MGYRNDFEYYKRETFWTVGRSIGLIILLMFLGTGLGIMSCAFGLIGGAANNAAQVVKKEFYPDALLRKYEWFKDASAMLDKKQADFKVYQVRLDTLAEAYKGLKRNEWPRDDREQHAIWSSEVAGIKASYNSLAAEYNAEMVKFNWRFTNIGDMPPGASTPLPREYKPYAEN